jgi:hypothetical protein
MEKEKVIDRLRKLKKIADTAQDESATKARNILDDLMVKFGISASDLDDDIDAPELHGFTLLDDELELILFCQVVGKVMGKYGCITRYNDCLAVEVTLTQRLEITEMFNFYLSELRRELSKYTEKHNAFVAALQKKADAAGKRLAKTRLTTTKAFVLANDLFPPLAEGDGDDLTRAEINEANRVARKAGKIKPKSFRKALNK